MKIKHILQSMIIQIEEMIFFASHTNSKNIIQHVDLYFKDLLIVVLFQ